jgi:predicted DNA-binding ribbon-helix-helix protein
VSNSTSAIVYYVFVKNTAFLHYLNMHATKIVGFRIDRVLWDQFKRVAHKRHATASELLREYIRREVAKG